MYGGTNQGNAGGAQADAVKMHHRPFSLKLILPPLSALFFASYDEAQPR
jgi:1,4-alpha-glucan branching enzyme